jgi:uncharacterized SAM-binding protein YcdF (DUF218 family)
MIFSWKDHKAQWDILEEYSERIYGNKLENEGRPDKDRGVFEIDGLGKLKIKSSHENLLMENKSRLSYQNPNFSQKKPNKQDEFHREV